MDTVAHRDHFMDVVLRGRLRGPCEQLSEDLIIYFLRVRLVKPDSFCTGSSNAAKENPDVLELLRGRPRSTAR